MSRNNSIVKTPTYVEGTFEEMSEIQVIEKNDRRENRATVTLTTSDGQKAFFEVRNRIITSINLLRIFPGQRVRIGFVFIGSEKNGKRYNNLFINEIETI